MDDNSIPSKLGSDGERIPEIRIQSDSDFGISSAFNQEVELIMLELGGLLIRKHQDYGPKNISDAPGGPINGLLVRMHDKMARLKNLHYNNKSANYESIEDTYKDLANYAVIALMVLRNKWDK